MFPSIIKKLSYLQEASSVGDAYTMEVQTSLKNVESPLVGKSHNLQQTSIVWLISDYLKFHRHSVSAQGETSITI